MIPHHVGLTVSSVESSVAFWTAVLGHGPLWRRTADEDYLSDVTGYRGVRLLIAMFELGENLLLELLEYEKAGSHRSPGTNRPGTAHLAFTVKDIDRIARIVLAAGGSLVSAMPVEVTSGANQGALAMYARDPDGNTIEFIQHKRTS